MKKILAALVVFTAFIFASHARDYEKITKPEVFKSGKDSLKYRIYSPEKIEKGKKYPIILFFHGAGERGDDNKRQLVHGARNLIEYSIKNNKPCFIIAPQCPKGMQWVNTPWNAQRHTMPKKPSMPMKLALELLDKKIKELPVDKKRIYVTGLSMGGYGTWDAIQRKPKLFAAAIPICGGGDDALASKIKNIPIWVHHGGKDKVVPTRRSRDMVSALKKAGGKPVYTEYENCGHGSWGPAYGNKKVLDWLFKQKKK